MTFFAIGQEETDEELANFRKWAAVQIDDYTQMPTCVVGPFDAKQDAFDYFQDGMNFAVVEMIPPNPTVMRIMREYRAQNTPNKETNA